MKKSKSPPLPAPYQTPWRVLLADDHPLFRTGLSVALADYPDFSVVGMAEDGDDVLGKVRELRPDLLILDLEMPELHGLQVLSLLKKAHPNLRVLILSCHDDSKTVQQALKLGAKGFVSKDAEVSEFITAIRTLRSNRVFLSPRLQASLDRLPPDAGDLTDLLTTRESQILGLIAGGLSNKEIAKKIGLSIRTIESHRLNLTRKLNIRGMADLIAFALKHGLAPLSIKPPASDEATPG